MRLPLNIEQYPTLCSVYTRLFRLNLQKRKDSTPTFGGYYKAPPQPTRCWSLVTLTPKLLETLKPGQASLGDMALELQQQQSPTARVLLGATPYHYKHNLPAKRQSENNLDASSFETPASPRLCFSAPIWRERCLTHQSDAQHRVSYRSPPCPLQTQPSVQTKTKEEWSQRKKTQYQRPPLSWSES